MNLVHYFREMEVMANRRQSEHESTQKKNKGKRHAEGRRKETEVRRRRQRIAISAQNIPRGTIRGENAILEKRRNPISPKRSFIPSRKTMRRKSLVNQETATMQRMLKKSRKRLPAKVSLLVSPLKL
jgi:hypothetical protein